MGQTRTNLENPLRLWRVKHGLTQQEVADLAGLSESFISRLESGDRKATPAIRVLIARALGVRIVDLFDVDETDEGATWTDS
jgi:transcriptional regulator with XRE-family HTH domain